MNYPMSRLIDGEGTLGMQTTLEMQTTLPPQASLSCDLERSRLEHRADRIEATLRALRDRQRLYAGTDAPRPALNAAISDFTPSFAGFECS